MPEISREKWDEFLNLHPYAHILQTSAWSELKSNFSWVARRIISSEGSNSIGGQILFRKLPLGFSIAYLPKGPVIEGDPHRWWDNSDFWREVDQICKEMKSIYLLVEPDCWDDEESIENNPENGGFLKSDLSVQPVRTIEIDITGDEDQILSRMKQKTRYNIRLAKKKDIRVSASSNVEMFSELSKMTAERDRFGVHTPEYYQQVYDLFEPQNQCNLLMAEFENECIAAIMVLARGNRSWYFYGASSGAHRNKMPNHLLQWEGIRWAQSIGCQSYDLWGVPDYEESDLEEGFPDRSDGLWGVYRFKRGFGGNLKRVSGPWVKVFIPPLYKIYQMIL